jgi:tRNA dimethylallyltransferase
MKKDPETAKIVVVLGQTSTGKSDYAVELAHDIKRFGIDSEIISADSRQVYRGMDLGTGKITAKEMHGVPHHMLDVTSPLRVYSVAQYQKHVQKIIKNLVQKNIVPILVGGTGFYIDAVAHGSTLPEVKPDNTLRKELAKKTKDQLYKMLLKLNPERAKDIDKNNPVRLIRAIEVATGLQVKTDRQDLDKKIEGKDLPASSQSLKLDVLRIGLALPDELLKEKIKNRILARIKKGMIKEIERLHSPKQGLGLTWKRLDSLGLEYRYGALYLQGKLTKDQMVEQLNTESWHYAKRQKTWFKRDENTLWIDPRDVSERAKALMKIKNFLR